MAFDPNAPRKPFVARGSRVERCSSCLMAAARCLCDVRPNIKGKAVFWLLTHHNEIYKPTNTGRLIVDTLQGCRVFKWGRVEPEPAFLEALNDPRYRPCIVFPSDEDYQQRMVKADYLQQDDRIPAFIILDGTWRQARRMFRLSRYLDNIPAIEPSHTAESRYQLRQSSEPHHLCTAEIAALMLREVNDTTSADVLDSYFDLFNLEYHASRVKREQTSQITAVRERLASLVQPLR